MTVELKSSNILQWVKEGRVFFAEHGDLTTPAAFETDLVVTTPDFLLRVPGGTVIAPLYVSVVTEATGAAVFQCEIQSCNNDPGVANRTFKDAVNVNTRYAAKGPQCKAYITSTGACTTPTGTAVLHHVYVQPDIDAITASATFEQVVYSPLFGKGVPALIGDDSNGNGLLVYVGNGTSATGYVGVYWAEFTYAEVYG